MKYYKKIVFDYPSSQQVVNAKLNIADIYYKQGSYTKSADEYTSVLDKYSADQAVCEKAVRGIIDIYKVTNQQDKVGAIVAKYPCANFSDDEQEDIYYVPAMDAYNADEYELSIGLFEKYLAQYPNGRYVNEVKNYIANAHYQTGSMAEAVRVYRETLEGPNTGFTELAAARVSYYLYNEEQYTEVIPYYERLEAVSATPEVIFNARLGVMRSAFLTEKWGKSAAYAEKVLTNSSINETIALEAYYAKGMANYYQKHYDEAKTALVWVVKNTTTVRSAEARYALADSYFQQDYLDNANDEVTGILKQKPAYNYWIARGLILRSRIYIKQNNLFDAEQTLKSVIEHYPNSDDGILDEANELWNELMQLKDKPKNVTPDTNPIIEVNDDKDGN